MKRITLLLTAGILMMGMTAMAQNPEKEQRRMRREINATESEMRQEANEISREARREANELNRDTRRNWNEKTNATKAEMRHMKHNMKRHEREMAKMGNCGCKGKESVKILAPQSTRIGDMVNFDFFLNYDKIFLTPREQFVVTPYITDGSDMMYMPPVVFIGERCYKKMMRKDGMAFGMELTELQPYEVVVMTKKDMRERRREMRKMEAEWIANSGNTVEYETQFPYQGWMDGSDIKLHHALTSCKAVKYEYTSQLATLYNPMPPQVMFIVPEVEVVKARSESMTARLVFKVNKTNIDPNIFNNSTELSDIYKFTDKIINNPDIKVTGVKLMGYASPEGPYNLNAKLSIGRVDALKELLMKKYPSIKPAMYTVNNVPEDWDSVRRWVAKSDLEFRDQVINIIDNYDPDKRDAKIRALDKGFTYNYLLKNVYPGLRRAVYTIDYTVMPFTVEQGKVVMVTNPQYLSLNEYYQIAMSYPMDSDEYMEVMEMAVRYFPNDPVANNNMAAMALQNNNLPMARIYLERIMNFPGAQNNIGVLKALEGDMEAAKAYFQKSWDMTGSKEAQYNLNNISSLRQTSK